MKDYVNQDLKIGDSVVVIPTKWDGSTSNELMGICIVTR